MFNDKNNDESLKCYNANSAGKDDKKYRAGNEDIDACKDIRSHLDYPYP
jgi:hypothetical protein